MTSCMCVYHIMSLPSQQCQCYPDPNPSLQYLQLLTLLYLRLQWTTALKALPINLWKVTPSLSPHWKSTQGSYGLITDVVGGPTLAELTKAVTEVQLGQIYSLLSPWISSSLSGVIPTQSPWYHSLHWLQQIIKWPSSGRRHRQSTFVVEATSLEVPGTNSLQFCCWLRF